MEAFRYLKEKVRKKQLGGWRDKTLSNAGKEILIQSIPTLF